MVDMTLIVRVKNPTTKEMENPRIYATTGHTFMIDKICDEGIDVDFANPPSNDRTGTGSGLSVGYSVRIEGFSLISSSVLFLMISISMINPNTRLM
jgi:hypothetical protein